MQERFASQGLEPRFSTPAQFDTYLQAEIAKRERVVKAAGLQVQ